MDDIEKKIDLLVYGFDKPEKDCLYAKEIIITALKMLQDDVSSLDLKISSRSLRDMHHAFKIFRKYKNLKKITIFGSARAKPESEIYQLAERFAEKIVEKGFMVITGGGGGIMEAGNKGAGRDASFGLNIRLPFEQKSNQYICGDIKDIYFKYFFTRKLFFIKEGDAIALFPGGFGTIDECMELLTLVQTGKTSPLPIVMIDTGEYWHKFEEYFKTNLITESFINKHDLNYFFITSDLDKACNHIANFYKNYHSLRVIGDKMVVRLKFQPQDGFVCALNEEFQDIIKCGSFGISQAFEEERRESYISHLPRLYFNFDGRSFGRLRKLIDFINDFPGEPIELLVRAPRKF